MLAREIDRDPRVLIAAQPTRGLDVGAIEFVHRRLVAERDEGRGDPARLARARGDPLALRPDPRHLRGRDRRRVPADGDRGAARHRDDRRRPRRRGGRVSDDAAGPAERAAGARPERSAPSVAAIGYALAQKAGGILAPVLTALLAFLVGRARRAGHDRQEPAARPTRRSSTARASTGCSRGSRATSATLAALNLQQTLLITTPLILTGLAVAFAFRCGMFNIGGQGQYLVGSFFAVWIGSSFGGHELGRRTSSSRSSSRRSPARRGPGSRAS